MPEHFYVYPSYLRRKGSRSVGRRVPLTLAAPDVTVEEIAEAARRLGFTAEEEPAKLYPREAHLFEGRVKIMKRPGASKTRAIHEIAAALKASTAAEGRS